MAERTFDLQVEGYTKEGYAITLIAHAVGGTKLATTLEWFGEQLPEAGMLPFAPKVGAHQVDPPGWPDTKLCPIHKVPMEYHEKGKSHWWSHKVQLEDGTEHWCRGK